MVECCNEMINGAKRIMIKIALTETITPNQLVSNYGQEQKEAFQIASSKSL